MIFLSFLFQFGGDQLIPVCVDVLDIAKTRDKLKDVGPVNLLVNNAGVSTLQSFLEVTPEDYDKWVGHWEIN